MTSLASIVFLLSALTNLLDAASVISPQIVGGVEAIPHEFPWVINLRRSDTGSHICGGTILNENWVMTAAHCLVEYDLPPSNFTVVAGDHDKTFVEGNEQFRKAVEYVLHPGQGYTHDIALVKVEPSFEFNQYVQPAIIPDNSNFNATSEATVIGWGSVATMGPQSPVLLKVDLPHVPDDTCGEMYGSIIPANNLCYGITGKSSCYGDSGGPLMCGQNRTVCGIVHGGMGCGAYYPGIYTKVTFYLDWIHHYISKNAEDVVPQTALNSCGRYVETSSGRIHLRDIKAGEGCVFVIKTEYDRLRLNLGESNLTSEDSILVSKLTEDGRIEDHALIKNLGANYTVPGGIVFITVNLHNSTSTRKSLALDFFSSGYRNTDALTSLNAVGSYEEVSFPGTGGRYRRNENALIVLSLEGISGGIYLNFTFMDITSYTDCSADYLQIHVIEGDRYTQVGGRYCGNELPPPVLVPQGVGLVTFKSSHFTGEGLGFRFQLQRPPTMLE